MRGAARAAGVLDVVSKVRFPLMGDEYLKSRVVEMVGAEDAEWLTGIVDEALQAKKARREGVTFDFVLLGQKALVDRVGVRWEEYTEGGGLQVWGAYAQSLNARDGYAAVHGVLGTILRI